jgi:hypothetical protein
MGIKLQGEVVDTIAGPIDKTLAREIKKKYKKAVKANKEVFVVTLADGEPHELYTPFAKYLLEYLESRSMV